MSRYDDEEEQPKKRYGIYKKSDQQWWVTLTIIPNREAKAIGRQCIENVICETKKRSKRMNMLTDLFQNVVNFSNIPYIDNTITRICLRTKVGPETQFSKCLPLPDALYYPPPTFMDVDLTGLECVVDEDDFSTIRYPSFESFCTKYPDIRSIKHDDLIGIGDKKCKLHDGVYKVIDGNGFEFVYKEPTSPADIKSMTNEVESLLLLVGSRNIVTIHGLVISANPYLTRRKIPSPPVVKGLLFQYAKKGSLGKLLRCESLEISWSQRLSWGIQIALGLQAIHGVNIAHLDLKSDNVVIDEQYNAFIIDLSRTGQTYGWYGPEMYVDNISELPLAVLQKGDIYSFGVVLWEIATREMVYIPMGMDHKDFFVMGSDPLRPRGYEELVMKCLRDNLDDRPTLVEVLSILRTLFVEAEE